MNISFIIPSIGTKYLPRLLSSLAKQKIQEDDELIIVCDDPARRRVVEKHLLNIEMSCQKIFIMMTKAVKPNYGHWSRKFGIRIASSDFMCFIDDDDLYLENAIEYIRGKLVENPNNIHVFKMHNPDIWRQPEISNGNISTQMFYIPGRQSPYPDWPCIYNGDWNFVEECAKKWQPIFHDQFIVTHNYELPVILWGWDIGNKEYELEIE